MEHLLDKGLEPALVDHLARLDGLGDREAGESFFDFRVADITMGSGHFLVSALDRIERAFSGYLARRALPAVIDELERLRRSAAEAMLAAGSAVEIENTQLLRRQIARRCIYGVDINPIAVELARLALWIHTFVPGLPLSFLDHGLVVGNSLVGIATLEEASKQLQFLLELPLFVAQTEDFLGPAQDALSRLAHLSDANAAEIKAARQAAVEARESVRPAAALFDVLTAAGISDELSTEVAQSGTFWIWNLPSILDSDAPEEARNILAELPPFHFPIAFPEVFLRERPGFDVILGNPPWEEATVEEDRFWTRHNPGFHSLTQRKQEGLKTQLRRERPDLVREFDQEVAQAALLRSLLVNSIYPGMGTGDPDLYKAACWRFWSLVRPATGRISVVLPRSALSAKGTKDFRLEIMRLGQFTDIVYMLNRAGHQCPLKHQRAGRMTCTTSW